MATDDKYDRQLRLWGPHGQRKLGTANILLLNAGPTGTEALKNLVLPGAGSFTIVDAEKVTEAECESNFFVSIEEKGKPRGKVACDFLVEMNPDTKGTFVAEDPDNMIDGNPDFFKQFTIIIATQLAEHYVEKLSFMCTQFDIPLVVCRSYGMIGQVRLVSREHCVVESKPSPAPAVDVRVANPFPTLQKYANSIDMYNMSDMDYKHVPYTVVLMKLADKWRASHDGKLPSNSKEKDEFRQQIKKLARQPWGIEENLEEALANAYLVFGPRPIPFEVEEVLESAPTKQLDLEAKSTKFWVQAKALASFVSKEGQGCLPLPGKLPDMTATTSLYVELQKVFQQKSEEDFKAYSSHVEAHLKELKLESGFIPEEDRRLFCKNSHDIQMLKLRSVSEELKSESANKDTFMMAVMEGVGDSSNQCPLLWYVMLRACDRFYEKSARYPGTGPDVNFSADISDLNAIVKALQQELGLEDCALSESHSKEMVRYGAGEIHNIAALIGGIASQECIKLLTAQYVPLNNTYIYNGITCTGAVYEL